MKKLIEELEELGEAKVTFHDVIKDKDKWVKMDPEDLQKHPDLADEFFQMVRKAYKPIGGHAKIKTPKVFFGGAYQVFDAADIDDDPEADVLQISKKTPAGTKHVAIGHDNSPAAKKELITQKAKAMKTRGNYGEASGAVAHILLTRYNVKYVDDPKAVRKVLVGKAVEWVGRHPDGKYPGVNGWYRRQIGDEKHLKILLGMPRVSVKKQRAKATAKVRR